jgi:hypothetical protein
MNTNIENLIVHVSRKYICHNSYAMIFPQKEQFLGLKVKIKFIFQLENF